MKYYGRLCIHPLTADGFAPPYVTEEGWNQGDNPSGETYQVSELVVSGSLPHPDDVRVPATPSGVPVSNLSYSDDRRLVRRTLSSLIDPTRLCTRATVAKGGLVHMDKLRFFALDLDGSVLRLQQTQVPHYLRSTSTDCPQVVGIPLSHALRPPGVYTDLAKQKARMRRRLDTNPASTILALRSLWAFILSQLGYVASGVAVPPEHVAGAVVQAGASVQARALYRQVLGLPCWTSRALMSLAPRYGGPGCPHLSLCSACRLLLTYTQASCSRNLLAQRSAQYLSQAAVPGSVSQPLREAALQLSVQIALLPDATTTAMPVLNDSNPAVLQRYHHLVLSTDAALRQCDGGGGIVFYAPGVGVVLRAWYGIRLWASPTGAKWLVRLVALHLLQGWHGCLVSSADCSSALVRGYTRFPPKLTVLELLWRRLCLNLLGLHQHCGSQPSMTPRPSTYWPSSTRRHTTSPPVGPPHPPRGPYHFHNTSKGPWSCITGVPCYWNPNLASTRRTKMPPLQPTTPAAGPTFGAPTAPSSTTSSRRTHCPQPCVPGP